MPVRDACRWGVLSRAAGSPWGTEMNEQGPNAGNPYVSTAQVAEALGSRDHDRQAMGRPGDLAGPQDPGGPSQDPAERRRAGRARGRLPAPGSRPPGPSPGGPESRRARALSAAMLAALKRGEAEA